LLLALCACLTLGAGPAAAAASDPAQELALRYAPVVRLVKQAEPCGHGEPYQPTNPNVVLGNDEVALRGPWDTTNIVKVGPTAADISVGLARYNLDFPGNALKPGCDYEQWADEITKGTPPTTYAYITTDPAFPGQLALQYWFFYVFNDWNDKHEGDWEMIQLDFRAATPEAALAKRPSEVGYSQHSGAEKAAWGDSKLTIVGGTHPVVYPAAGSHANYFTSALYLGHSAAQGVGCDDTLGPSVQLRPEVQLIPTGREAYLKAFPWLGYDGRWGEPQKGFYNGPTGPTTKEQWTAPITWATTDWRDTSYAVPATGSNNSAATDFFCGAVERGSNLLTAFVGDPSPVLFVLGAFVVLILWLISRTRWEPAVMFRVRRRRRWGVIVSSAWRLYSGHLRLFLGIGVLFVPIGILITLVQYLIFRVAGLKPLVDSVGSSNAFVVTLALALGIFFTLVGLSVVQTVTAIAVVELDEGRPVSARSAYRLALPRLGTLLRGLVLAGILIAVLNVIPLGSLLALWLVVRWSLLGQVAGLERLPARASLHRSARLVRGDWWRTASLTFFITGFGLLLGPLVGSVLILLTTTSFNVVNLIASLIYAVALPFVAIATTYLYFDLLVEDHQDAQAPSTTAILPAEI
jgi:hypothetical protein